VNRFTAAGCQRDLQNPKMQKFVLALLPVTFASYVSEIKIMPEHDIFDDYSLPLPSSYLGLEDLPTDFNWADYNGQSFVTKNLNQHIP
jgi:hypothetical protein